MDIMLERILETIPKKHGAIKELAETLGISGNNISDWKGGRNKSYRQYAPKIAEYYGVSLDWLSGLSDEKGIKNPPAVSDEGGSIDEEALLAMYRKIPDTQKAEALAGFLDLVKKYGNN